MAAAPAASGLEPDFLLEIVVPERQLVAERVDAVRAPGIEGEFGVLPSHTRMISGLGTGTLRYRRVGAREWSKLAVSSGMVEVLPDRVIVLAQTAEMRHEIDIVRAQAALDRAQERLEHPDPDTDIERALDALRRAMVRVEAARAEEAD